MAIVSVLAIFFVVAFLVYGAFSAVTGLPTPGGASPLVFLTSVLVVKLGHAVAFVLLFHLARGSFSANWLFYAFSWWLMFAIGEVGQAIAPNYSWQEAIAGILSETVYFPAAAFVTKWWLATGLDRGPGTARWLAGCFVRANRGRTNSWHTPCSHAGLPCRRGGS